MSVGKILALIDALFALLILGLIILHVAASIPAWVLPLLILAACIAIVIG